MQDELNDTELCPKQQKPSPPTSAESIPAEKNDKDPFVAIEQEDDDGESLNDTNIDDYKSPSNVSNKEDGDVAEQSPDISDNVTEDGDNKHELPSSFTVLVDDNVANSAETFSSNMHEKNFKLQNPFEYIDEETSDFVSEIVSHYEESSNFVTDDDDDEEEKQPEEQDEELGIEAASTFFGMDTYTYDDEPSKIETVFVKELSDQGRHLQDVKTVQAVPLMAEARMMENGSNASEGLQHAQAIVEFPTEYSNMDYKDQIKNESELEQMLGIQRRQTGPSTPASGNTPSTPVTPETPTTKTCGCCYYGRHGFSFLSQGKNWKCIIALMIVILGILVPIVVVKEWFERSDPTDRGITAGIFTSAPSPAPILAPGETHAPSEYSPPTVAPTSTLCFSSKEELRGALEFDVQGQSEEWLLDTYGWIGNWCVSRLTDFSGLFRDLDTFNKPLAGWDMSNAKDTSSMFSNAAAFNQDLSTWNTSSFTDTSKMFRGAKAFNQTLSLWDVSRVTTLYAMVRL